MEAQPWVIGCIATPLVAGLLSFLAGRRAADIIGLVAAPVVGVMAAGLVWQTNAVGAHRHSIGGWGPPLGIDLYADGLSVVMVAATAVVGLFVSLYAFGYFSQRTPDHDEDDHTADQRARQRASFWPLWMLLWAALNALFLSSDLFNLYVSLELIGLSAVALVALAGKSSLSAAMRYLLVTLAGSLFFLMGVALLYSAHGTLDLALLSQRIEPGPIAQVALALMTAGLLLKTALFPLHFWLPDAHAAAPAPVSAVLSGLVVKASFYLVLRLWLEVFAPAITLLLADLLAMLGMLAIVWGSIQAIRQSRLKMLVAYSTVAQLGYLFVIFSPAIQGAPGAFDGGIYHAISHGCAKGAMFLSAGTLAHAVGDDDIASLRGVREHLAPSFFSFALAGISLMGLPPSGGFIAKWLIVKAAIDSGRWLIVIVIFMGGLLTAVYVFKVLRMAFVSTPADHKPRLSRVLPTMQLAPFTLALIALVLGLLAWAPLELLSIGLPFDSALVPGGGR